MMRYLLATMLLAVPMFGEGPEFEVASIKSFDLSKAMNPANGGLRIGPSGGGPGTNDPTHMNFPAMTLLNALMQAFDVKNYQVINTDGLSQMFEFALVLPEGAKKEDLKFMWRNLLISRFGLKYRIEQREFPVDELVVGPKGHKLAENKEPIPEPVKPAEGAPGVPFTPPKIVDGRPVLTAPGMITLGRITPNGVTQTMVARAQPLTNLISMLSGQLGHPVVDKTGLTGNYDYAVEYAGNVRLPPEITAQLRNTQPPAGVGNPAPVEAAEPSMDLVGALQQQLGLRLVKGKGMLDVVVVEKIEKTPTEN